MYRWRCAIFSNIRVVTSDRCWLFSDITRKKSDTKLLPIELMVTSALRRAIVQRFQNRQAIELSSFGRHRYFN